MQIREADNRITLIRVAPDPAGRYKRQEIIGTFRRDGDSVPQNLLAKLTADERRHLTQWLSGDPGRQSLAVHRETFSKVGTQIDALVAALDEAAEVLNPADADVLWQRLAQVSRALKRAGFEKPRRSPKPPSVLSGQIDLFEGLG